MDNKVTNLAADNIRILAASMVEKANSGHPGGAMGGADFVNVLFSEYLVYDPENPRWEGRDRFFLDPGHMSPMLYSVLALTGKFTMEELSRFRQWDSPTPGHPEVNVMRGIENTSGPLGQGHTYAVGAAIAAKFLKARLGDVMNQTIYAYISDGGVQEEISQGSGRLAGHLGLDNLIMFYDSNDIQLSTATDAVTSEDVAKKYEAWNWKVITIDGNDPDAIRGALDQAKQVKGQPTLIIGKTVMGKGARKADGSSYENNCATHGAPLGGDAYVNTVKNLGGDPENPFRIFPEVQELYARRAEELKKIVAARYAAKAEWAKANPELAAKMEDWFAGKAPVVNWDAIEQKPGAATRAASATVLGALATQVENMIVSSADLSNSDKTDGFLKKTHAFTRDDFSGAFLQAGVSELTMACCCIGMALHGGVIPACATFFVFSDAEETTVAWRLAMENTATPTALIFSRQNIANLPAGNDYNQVSKGAYIVAGSDTAPDVVLVASGSEVSTLVAGAEKLRAEGIKVRIVSAPSEGLFRMQSKEYQESVIPSGAKVFGLTAGLPVTLEGLVGANGKVFGLESFGFSAPYKVLDEKLGFTAQNVYDQVKAMLA